MTEHAECQCEHESHFQGDHVLASHPYGRLMNVERVSASYEMCERCAATHWLDATERGHVRVALLAVILGAGMALASLASLIYSPPPNASQIAAAKVTTNYQMGIDAGEDAYMNGSDYIYYPNCKHPAIAFERGFCAGYNHAERLDANS